MVNTLNEEYKINDNAIAVDSYDNMAGHYFEYVDSKPFNAYYERPATTSLIPDVKGKTVLDAGCAAGWYTKWLLDKGADVIALDISKKMIEMTRRRVGDRARLVRADLNEPLSFIESESIDVIVSSLSLHYLKDWKLVLSEFNRILAKDGKLIISMHHPFMDYSVYNRENYFLTELIDDEWTIAGEKFQVQFYRRPISSVINSVIEADFIIKNVLEPMPIKQFKVERPDQYERLTKKPQFLFLLASKE